MQKRLLKTDRDFSAFFLRLTLVLVLFPHGAQKVLGWFGGEGIESTLQHLQTNLGIPLPLAIAAVATQFSGVVCLLVGFLTRVAALAIAAEMVVAIYLVHLQYGFFMNSIGQETADGYEYVLLVLGICLALMIKGGGPWSIDRAIVKRAHRGEIYLPMH